MDGAERDYYCLLLAEESNRPFIDRSLGTSVPAAWLPAPNPSFGHTHDVLLMCVFNRFPSMPICRGETSFPSPVTVTHWLIEFRSGKVNLHLGRVPDGPPHWTRPKDKGHGPGKSVGTAYCAARDTGI